MSKHIACIFIYIFGQYSLHLAKIGPSPRRQEIGRWTSVPLGSWRHNSFLPANLRTFLTVTPRLTTELGTFGIFFIFSIIKNDFFSIFHISAPVQFKKPSPSQINLIKNVKKIFWSIFYYWKNTKNTESAQFRLTTTSSKCLILQW